MSDYIPKLEYGDFIPTQIIFTYPPRADDGDQYSVQEKSSISVNGTQWNLLENVEAHRKIVLSFLTETEIQNVRSFFINHASKGLFFKWYTDKELPGYNIYQLKTNKFNPKKVTSKAGAFIWEVDLEFRRVEGSTESGSMSLPILNNQLSPISLAGLSFSGSTSGKIIYEVRRFTDSNSAYSIGDITLLYKPSTGWEMSENYFGDPSGVSFTITSLGQMQYTSDNMAGTNYSGIIYLKDIKTNV